MLRLQFDQLEGGAILHRAARICRQVEGLSSDLPVPMRLGCTPPGGRAFPGSHVFTSEGSFSMLSVAIAVASCVATCGGMPMCLWPQPRSTRGV